MDLPNFDSEEPCTADQSKNLTEELVDGLGTGLEHVEKLLQQLEDYPDLLGPAILRKCNELADGVGQVVNELDRHTNEQRLMLVDACQQDCAVMMESDPNAMAISQKDWLNALSGATILLKDVQSAFRDVGADDAEEIADVTLVVARMFLMSLQSVHSSIEDKVATNGSRIEELSDKEAAAVVGELSDEDGDDEFSKKEAEFDAKIARAVEGSKFESAKSKTQKRMRVIWPPLGPHVVKASN